MNARLEAKVKAINDANAYAPELYAKLIPIFAPYVGQKIIKADGSLIAKIEKQIPELAPFTYRSRSNYSLGYVAKTCAMEPGGNGCAYHETYVSIGELRDGMLSSLAPAPTGLRTDYTVEEVETKRKAVEKADKALDDAKGELYPFDIYDR